MAATFSLLVSFQFMMSNKLARLFVFAYSVLLHLLVFLVLMRYTQTTHFPLATVVVCSITL